MVTSRSLLSHGASRQARPGFSVFSGTAFSLWEEKTVWLCGNHATISGYDSRSPGCPVGRKVSTWNLNFTLSGVRASVRLECWLKSQHWSLTEALTSTNQHLAGAEGSWSVASPDKGAQIAEPMCKCWQLKPLSKMFNLEHQAMEECLWHIWFQQTHI